MARISRTTTLALFATLASVMTAAHAAPVVGDAPGSVMAAHDAAHEVPPVLNAEQLAQLAHNTESSASPAVQTSQQQQAARPVPVHALPPQADQNNAVAAPNTFLDDLLRMADAAMLAMNQAMAEEQAQAVAAMQRQDALMQEVLEQPQIHDAIEKAMQHGNAVEVQVDMLGDGSMLVEVDELARVKPVDGGMDCMGDSADASSSSTSSTIQEADATLGQSFTDWLRVQTPLVHGTVVGAIGGLGLGAILGVVALFVGGAKRLRGGHAPRDYEAVGHEDALSDGVKRDLMSVNGVSKTVKQ